jgi:iron complex outermembrane receptor protein
MLAKALLATTSLFAILPQTASAQSMATTATAKRAYNIPSQSLDGALAAFSRIAGVQVLNKGATTQGVTSLGAKGAFTAQEAVTRLLAGTGLIPRFVGLNTVTVTSPTDAASGAPTVPGAIMLDTITVQGAGSGSTFTPPPEYAGGQVATGGQLGLLGNSDVMSTPFNQTSFTAKKIADQQAQTIRDVLIDDPSVRSTIPDNGAGEDRINIRGFPVPVTNLSYGGLYGVLPAPC